MCSPAPMYQAPQEKTKLSDDDKMIEILNSMTKILLTVDSTRRSKIIKALNALYISETF